MPLNLCPLCDEGGVQDAVPIWTPEGQQQAHRACMLREVLGGIGHLIAHDYWCREKHDPDAGLTRYQSAVLVDTWVSLKGVEAAAAIQP